jgi:hypothetical protein
MFDSPSGPTGLAAKVVVRVEVCRVCNATKVLSAPIAGELSTLLIGPHCWGLYWPEKTAALLETIGDPTREPPGDAEYGEGLRWEKGLLKALFARGNCAP